MSRQGFSTRVKVWKSKQFCDEKVRGFIIKKVTTFRDSKTAISRCSKNTHHKWDQSTRPRLDLDFLQLFSKLFEGGLLSKTGHAAETEFRGPTRTPGGQVRLTNLDTHVKITRSKFQKISICEYQMAISKDPRRGGCVENVWPPNVQIFSLISVSQTSLPGDLFESPHTKAGMRPSKSGSKSCFWNPCSLKDF